MDRQGGFKIWFSTGSSFAIYSLTGFATTWKRFSWIYLVSDEESMFSPFTDFVIYKYFVTHVPF